MKKIILICILFASITAFTVVKAEKLVATTDTEVVTEKTNGHEITLISNSNNFDEDSPCCTVNVYFNGVLVASFQCCLTSSCACAIGQACQYIENNGGTCPTNQN